MTASSTAAQRAELGDLLRARRAQLDRAELGFPPVARSRTRGLRREEVSALSGVSVTWYTWLEQGRDIRPSRQVLDAVARTLRLSTTEHAYVLSLAGYAPPARSSDTADRAPGHVQRLLDALPGSPAFALARDWGIAGWNRAYAALNPRITTLPADDRNLLCLVFTDAYVRALLPDWQTASRRFLAEFRAEAGPHLSDAGVTAVVERLNAVSAEFRAGWTNHDIEGFTSRERHFRHPVVGDLILEQHRLTPVDHPELHVVVYTPVDDGRTPTALAELLGRATSF